MSRKTLVLDLDETLIHSHHDGVMRQTVKPGTPPDFVLRVTNLHLHHHMSKNLISLYYPFSNFSIQLFVCQKAINTFYSVVYIYNLHVLELFEN